MPLSNTSISYSDHIVHCKVQIERGISYSEAIETLHADTQPGEGFYLSKKVRLYTYGKLVHSLCLGAL